MSARQLLHERMGVFELSSRELGRGNIEVVAALMSRLDVPCLVEIQLENRERYAPWCVRKRRDTELSYADNGIPVRRRSKPEVALFEMRSVIIKGSLPKRVLSIWNPLHAVQTERGNRIWASAPRRLKATML